MGVLAFGQNMKDIILFALPNDSAEIKIFQISYAIALALTYPLQIIPVFRILEDNQTIKSYLMSGVPQNNNGD
jgi:proton-coupled amino acid transporter